MIVSSTSLRIKFIWPSYACINEITGNVEGMNTHVQDPCDFSVASKFYKDAFTERQSDEVERLLDA